MENSLNIRSKKRGLIIERLRRADMRRSHKLYIHTCYFSVDAAKKLISDVRSAISITEIQIYIDKREAIKISYDGLNEFVKSFRGIDVKLWIVNADKLFHSKAYAVVCESEETIQSGSLVVGSGNLTEPGITMPLGNIESFLDTQDVRVIEEFIAQSKKLECYDYTKLPDLVRHDKLQLYYSIISCGRFVHKWTDSITQYLSVRYNLNENGKNRIGDQSITAAGFDIDSATISKSYFRYESPFEIDIDGLFKNYGIETHLGFWIPKSVLDDLTRNDDNFDKFKSDLKREIKVNLKDIKTEIAKNYGSLIALDVIDKNGSEDPAVIFEKKTKELLNNQTKLKRLYTKISDFDFPYEAGFQEFDDAVRETFLEIKELSIARKRRNKAMKTVLLCINNKNTREFDDILQSFIEGE